MTAPDESLSVAAQGSSPPATSPAPARAERLHPPSASSDMMRPLRILLVINWPLTHEAGGLTTMVRTLATGLSRRHETHVLLADWDARILRTGVEGGLVTHRLRLRTPWDPAAPLRNFVAWIRDTASALRQLLRLQCAHRFDVVHIHFVGDAHCVFRLARPLGGPPYVVTLHRGETLNFPRSSYWQRAFLTWTLRGAARTVAVSKWLAEFAERTFPSIGPVPCVHNGYDLPDAANLRPPGGADRRTPPVPEPFFLLVANLAPHKGQDIAIRAWAELRSRFPQVHLVIVGEPRDHWDGCVRLIRDLGCQDRVHMLGAMPHAQVLALMGKAVGLVAPSRSEGFGLVVLEAGLQHLPVVCSRIGPFLEIVEDGRTALVVPPDDPAALAAAVTRLIENPALREQLGAALESDVRTTFSVQQMADRYETLYRDVCGMKSLPTATRVS